MAIDYNRLMEELDSCLGLESSATESVKRPSGPSKKRKAFEGYDDVDMEIIQAMKDSPEGAPSEFSEEDLVYSDDNQGMPGVEDEEADKEESPEVKLADSVDCLFNDYVQSGKTPQEAADSIKDLVESAVAELYDPDEGEDNDGDEAEADESCKKKADEGMEDVVTPVKEVSSHSIANKSADESLIDNSRLEEIFEDFWDGSGLGTDPSLEKTTEYAKNYLEVYSPDELKEYFGPYSDPKRLAKKMLEMRESANKSAEECNSGSADDGDSGYDPDAAFEALSSKMLNRYSQLTHRNQLKSKKSAEEGVSATEVKIDDNAIRRVSCEFAYSGKNLRKMVAEAIQKGVI